MVCSLSESLILPVGKNEQYVTTYGDSASVNTFGFIGESLLQ
jgi:hypothetical protein